MMSLHHAHGILDGVFIARQQFCPSVTFRYQMKMAKNIVIIFTPYGSPIIRVLPASNIFTKFRRVTPYGGLNTGGVEKIRDFLPINRYISQTIQNIAIVAMEGEWELVCDLSNGAISNDLERTLTLFSRSHQSLTLNISQTATDTATVTIEGE